jgi:LPXTG-motif cell wall-anchored protein
MKKEGKMKQRMASLMVVVLVALLALPLVVHAQEPDPVQMIQDLEAKLQARDFDGALEYVSDDIVLYLVPPPPGGKGVFTGKEELRARWEESYALNTHSEYRDCETSGNTTTCAVSYEGDDTRALGIGPLEMVLEFVVEDGLITSFTWTVTDESLAAVAAAMAALPQTGGGAFPIQEVLVGLGGLAVAGGLGLGRLRRRSR